MLHLSLTTAPVLAMEYLQLRLVTNAFVNLFKKTNFGLNAPAYATQFVISSSTFETNRGLVSNDGGSLVIDSTIFSAPAAFSVVLDNLLVLRNTNGNYDIAGVYLNLLNHNATVTRSLFQGQNSGHGGNAICRPNPTPLLLHLPLSYYMAHTYSRSWRTDRCRYARFPCHS